MNRRRGRPPKFDSPSQLVALTLPDSIVTGLKDIHPDLAWAIVSLFQKHPPGVGPIPRADFELLRIAERQSLIVVNRARFSHLPGVDIVPLSEEYAFLALAPGQGLSDLELAVVDRLEEPSASDSDAEILRAFRQRLRDWRTNGSLTFRTRAIIVVEERHSQKAHAPAHHSRRSPRKTR